METRHDPGDPLEASWQRCRAARPELAVSLEAFRAHVAARRPADVDADTQLRTFCLDDLYLACACLAGDPRALQVFEREVMPAIESALARWAPQIAADARQDLRSRILVDHAGRGPLLASYNGRGALRAWLRVIARREAGRTWRAEAALAEDDDGLFDALAPDGDPALLVIKAEAAAAFKTAFVRALGELERRERTVLRLHVLDGLTIDEIAPLYGAHRATIARWITGAKQAVLGATRRALMHDLRLGPDEVDSLIRLVQSRIELTEALLQTTR